MKLPSLAAANFLIKRGSDLPPIRVRHVTDIQAALSGRSGSPELVPGHRNNRKRSERELLRLRTTERVF